MGRRELVNVDGHNMCVYAEGSGKNTLVFLAGSAICSPILEYKALYKSLSDEFKVVVIERFGYGNSDVVDTERSFDTIVRQDREALSKLGIEGPFVLCPHSMAGVEALKWASDFPCEIQAIIGLDMAVPQSYDTIDKRIESANKTLKLVKFLRSSGLIKLMSNNMLSVPSTLSKDEIKEYRSLMYTKFGNICVQNETLNVAAVRDELYNSPKPAIPILLFVSDGKFTGEDEQTWRSHSRDYAKDAANVRIVEVPCGHNLYNIETGSISRQIRSFINS